MVIHNPPIATRISVSIFLPKTPSNIIGPAIPRHSIKNIDNSIFITSVCDIMDHSPSPPEEMPLLQFKSLRTYRNKAVTPHRFKKTGTNPLQIYM